MLKERLQILVDGDQRRRLDGVAAERGLSVGALVRAAIDAELGRADRSLKLEAVAEMRRAASRSGGPAPPVAELDRIVDEQRGARYERSAHGDR